MKIVFLLPIVSKRPIGGYKVVYEYANRLAADGFRVTIVYPATAEKLSGKRSLIKYLRRRLLGTFKCKWFELEPHVREKHVWSLEQKNMPKADVYIATAVQTSSMLNAYNLPPERKFYFIQGFEAWRLTPEEVIDTYRYPMRKVTIAKWLLEIIENSGEKAEYIPNGFDFDFFTKNIDPALRNPYRIAMLWHISKLKGCEYGLEALKIVKEAYPQTEAVLFGVKERPEDIPEWIEYHQMPDRETFNRIYNEAAIYFGTSNCEGFGLTIGEAMICGTAVVCTDIDGYREMAIPDETALMVPVRDSRAMADAILRLINDNELRIRLAAAGNERIKEFKWDSSYAKLRSLIEAVEIG